GWGTPEQAKLGSVTVDEVIEMKLPAGSMGPKVAAACEFATATGHEAVIGSLADIDQIVKGSAGTRVRSA
ncbi:MAG TPA: carbamate kinase, partial [Mycobacterium sp.]|nr:carbamate kinase [Mycobacterium sp.]